MGDSQGGTPKMLGLQGKKYEKILEHPNLTWMTTRAVPVFQDTLHFLSKAKQKDAGQHFQEGHVWFSPSFNGLGFTSFALLTRSWDVEATTERASALITEVRHMGDLAGFHHIFFIKFS